MAESFDLRLKEKRGIDPDEIYGSLGDMFCLKFFHGGNIRGDVTKVYVGGEIDIIDNLYGNKLSLEEIHKMIKFLGEKRGRSTQFSTIHYRIPGHNMQTGLVKLCNNEDLKNMISYTKSHKCLTLYVDVGEPIQTTNIPQSPELSQNRGTFVSQKRLHFEKMDYVDKWVPNVVYGEGSSSRGLNDGAGEEILGDDVVVEVVDDSEDTLDSDGGFMASDDGYGMEPDGYYFDTNVDETVEWYDKAHKETGGKDKSAIDLEEVTLDDFASLEGDPLEDESPNDRKRQPRNPQFHAKVDMVKPKFYLCQEFGSKNLIKEALLQHSIDTRRDLRVVRNDNKRIRAICKGMVPAADESENKQKDILALQGRQCPWTLYASKRRDSTWQIKTFVETHWCLQTRKIRACTYKFLAKGLTETVRSNPQIPVSALKQDLEEKFQVNVSRMKAFRAKAKAHNLVMGSYKEQYTRLRDYCNQIMKTNPGSTMKIEVEDCVNPDMDTRVFKRIYCCLGPLKRGFKEGCRPLLGVDGTFIKGPYPGQLLTAIGIDSNNGIYPVAWALVEAENMRSWEWFFSCLGDDLDLNERSNFCFISDRQKGLIPALMKVFPSAEHRFCLKHIWENFKLQFKGLAYKDLLWSAACATNVPYFDQAMEELKKMDEKAWQWLKEIPPAHWSKSHFSLYPKCDMLYNNLCETFNSKILEARDKPIITCLESIRLYATDRIVAVRRAMAKSHGILCPNIEKLFDKIKEKASPLRAHWNGGSEYQISGPFGDQVVVDMENRSCSCRRWDLTGIPCKHAVRAIWSNVENGGDSLPENWVDDCYKVDTWKRIYSHEIRGITSSGLWSRQLGTATLLPPIHHVQPGRPKKARRRTVEEITSQRSSQSRGTQSGSQSQPHEENGQPKVMTKKPKGGGTVRCRKCGNEGHNSRTCKGQGGSTSAPGQNIPNDGPSMSHVNNAPPVRTFQNGSSYRKMSNNHRGRPVFGTRGSMFWFGPRPNQN